MVTAPILPSLVKPLIANNTPGYRGATYTVYTGNTGVNTSQGSGKTMREGDWVAYLGNTGAWEQGYCYRWNGSSWDKILMTETGPYMAALPDITENGPIGIFSHVLTAQIMALQAVADRIETQLITLRNPGAIQSSNYDPNQPAEQRQGFIIKATGDVEFNSGVFRAELAARQIRITGTVSSPAAGENGYLLRSNSMASIIQPVSTRFPTAYEGVLKEISTPAKGTCSIRIKFPTIVGIDNCGYYRVEVNEVTLPAHNSVQFDATSADVIINIYNVPLSADVNFIRLYGRPLSGGGVSSYVVINTLFELRCAQAPGLLAMLG